MASEPRTITYRFNLDNGNTWTFSFRFDEAQRIINDDQREIHPWTRLSFHQCPGCPLACSPERCCPVARNIDRVIEESKNTLSYTKATVVIDSNERTYTRNCAVQEGLRSLFGLIMASSGCPRLDWLRPLARFHLPFASIEENLFRVLSLQLLEDFLKDRKPGAETPTDRIQGRYTGVEEVNHSFIKRIRSYCEEDADKNAIAALDVFVQFFPYHIESNFDVLRKYFQ